MKKTLDEQITDLLQINDSNEMLAVQKILTLLTARPKQNLANKLKACNYFIDARQKNIPIKTIKGKIGRDLKIARQHVDKYCETCYKYERLIKEVKN